MHAKTAKFKFDMPEDEMKSYHTIGAKEPLIAADIVKMPQHGGNVLLS